eukprot:CAMPEP_0185784702 /NCGR_PEP_ID=MMETSP1174-20130828/124853_1 /TAXON_ID=35687 /ORGANISM="Dictyocha speculum, Strain CCMP1381" /LENGTH=85 /DNA_ID=CAMNT_0028476417 /DNA_START=18 /DNA_END=272 /DNA_ORIENTATION=+
MVLKQGALKFNDKPRAGLQHLQKADLLKTPLDATEVALFLRSAPGLDKDAIGQYLGAKGKAAGESPDTYLGDSEAFHAEILACFC